MTMTRAGRSLRHLALAVALLGASQVGVQAESTPPEPAAPQPTLPGSIDGSGKPSSQVVDQIFRQDRPQLLVRKAVAADRHRVRHRRSARIRVPRDLDRPALAGVELVAPLPPPGEPPHLVVPLPAYPLDSIATALTTPLPPIVCRPVRREPGLPDPHLYREVPVACESDNP